ncbi:hypothetical protein [Halopseudomonas oceani]|uniref:hypothetical protein n=1 Tax=Halopseudomonas oceani TaxID=1708783 RepID=UPI002AA936EA|nr:hypothetical protein [Halopseudomonas oceani]
MTLDKDDYKASILEQVAAHPTVTAAATAVAAGASFGAAIFLPVLTGTLAARRHEERLAKFINDVSEELRLQERRLDELSDAQYQLIGDAVACALQTVNQEKLDYLRHVIRNSLSVDINSVNHAHLARVIRDISGDEAGLLMQTSVKPKVMTLSALKPKRMFTLDSRHHSYALLSGLISLGLVEKYTDGDANAHGGVYAWTPLAEVLHKLLSA